MTATGAAAYRFEYHEGKEKWNVFPAPTCATIYSAVSATETNSDVTHDGEQWSIDLKKMSMSKGNDMKLVRCALKSPTDGNFYVWSFKDDKNFWRSYSFETSTELEEAYQLGETEKKIEVAGKIYNFHFHRLLQQSEDTGFRRKISRIKSNASSHESVKMEPQESKRENSKSASSGSGNVLSKSSMRTIKGRPPVDPDAAEVLGPQNKAHVFVDDSNGDIYDVLLNQTNLAQNNNKYYIVQLIESDSGKQYWSWTRWGRVGYRGQNNLDCCGGDLEKAKQLFENKFYQKTGNDWAERKNFVKRGGKYDLIERDFGHNNGDDVEDEVSSENTENEVYAAKSAPKRRGSVSSHSSANEKKPKLEPSVESKLDIRLRNIIEMICDIRDMEEVVVSMNYDVNKAPLGKLTANQLKAGYEALRKIADIIEAKDEENLIVKKVSSSRRAPSSGRLNASARAALIDACNEFYTRVPHSFGFSQPPLIQSHAELKSKLELLETLGDIEIAIHSMKEELSIAAPEHPIDKHYRNLGCSMVPVEVASSEFSLIDRYLHDTHGHTHNNYKMELMEVFAVDRQDEATAFRSDIGNNMLLWHGSRLTNYYGILSQGLRIAPPEAPVTGYMFGKGVYFADCASKSANYCQTSSLRNIGFLMLCKVALGKPNELMAADYKADKLPSGYNSVKGLGKFIPDSKSFATLDDGTVVPSGRLIPNSDPNATRYSLLYNEYIVYDTKQVVMKYICKVKFNFTI